jgi:hypothetical protein
MLNSYHQNIGRDDTEDDPIVAGSDSVATLPLMTQRLDARDIRPKRQAIFDNLEDACFDAQR